MVRVVTPRLLKG